MGERSGIKAVAFALYYFPLYRVMMYRASKPGSERTYFYFPLLSGSGKQRDVLFASFFIV